MTAARVEDEETGAPPSGRFDDAPLAPAPDDPPRRQQKQRTRAREEIKIRVEHDTRPDITITADTHVVTAEMTRALCGDPNLYSRDHKLVHVIASEEIRDGESVLVPHGTPTVREVPLSALIDRVSAHARCLSFDNRSHHYVHKAPPVDRVRAVHEAAHWPGIPELIGVTETPIVHDDGAIHDAPGFDPTTGYYLAAGFNCPSIPDRPTQSDAARALIELAAPFKDFPFVSDAARYVPIAAALSMILRPTIHGAVPGFAFDAPQPGSGKSLAAQAAIVIGVGRAAGGMTWPSDDAELEKVLGGYALRGAAAIFFDNLTTPLGGGPIDKVLTAIEKVDLRILGRTEVPVLPWRSVVLFTGNNLRVSGDTRRRLLVARIEAGVERPELRRFPFDPVQACIANRPSLVAAALTIARAWILAGRPQCDVQVLGSFEPWSRTVAAALAFAGAPDVTTCVPSIDGSLDTVQAAHDTLLRELARFEEKTDTKGFISKAVLDLLYPGGRPPGPQGPPDEWDDLRGAIETLAPCRSGAAPTSLAFGRTLAELRGVIVGGRCLKESGRARSSAIRWTVHS